MKQKRKKIIIILIIESEYTKQVMHDGIAHRSLTDAQPVPEQWTLASLPPSLLLSRCHMLWHILLVWGQLSWLCPHTASCVPPAFSLAGHKELKSSQLSIKTEQQQLKHQRVINTILALNLNSTTPAIREKINSIPAATRTKSQSIIFVLDVTATDVVSPSILKKIFILKAFT